MKRFARCAGFRVFASVSALPAVLFASAAFAQSPMVGTPAHANDQSPFANTVTRDELETLRGGAAVTGALPSVRLWDELGGRGSNRPPPPGAAVLNDGTLTIRTRGGR
jgi:hypothetical protein